jgi:uncharacterized flavoprotein (TIGR03862 family)
MPVFSVAVIGGGPAGLMAAETLARGGAQVTVYERMPSPARKLLMAGRGGLNLTHTEALPQFLDRYGTAEPYLRSAIEAFPPTALRAWAEDMRQWTFVGSSGRVFPKAMKASPLLRSWLLQLDVLGVSLRTRHRFEGFENGKPVVDTPEGRVVIEADATVLALGGASWPRLGSDGAWTALLKDAGVAIAPLQPANCGFAVAWSEIFRNRFEGEPLKRIGVAFGGRMARGEAIITRDGLEGGALYALSGPLRDTIGREGEAVLHIDLRPDHSVEELEKRLAASRGKQSLSTFLRKSAHLSPTTIGLLQEATAGKVAGMTPAALAALIKALPVHLTGVAPIARAISSAGGIAFDAVDERFMLRKLPGVFVAGEMLDWEAPTGGYLLQACFSTGLAAGQGALAWLNDNKS